MILLIGGEKGGTGKSTISTNLATALAHKNCDVLLIDADQQSTAARWSERRAEDNTLPPVHCIQRTGENIRQAILDLSQRYEQVIIDAGGRDSRELRSAMVAADALCVPIRPSQTDLETTAHVDEILSMARSMRADGGPTACALISMAPTHHLITETEQAKSYLTEFTSLKLASTTISDRKVYRDAMIEGKGVIEMDNPRARDEIDSLIEELYK